ncbi:MAG: hypothetical protein CMM01_04680 [Rhodopirellula sp.]|nr:hypothetical protein [Rhodopirellula sp.]
MDRGLFGISLFFSGRDLGLFWRGDGKSFQPDRPKVLGSMLASDGFSAIVEQVIDPLRMPAPLILL